MNILNESIFDGMVFCVVVGCTNHSNKKGEKFSFFHLPGHAHLRNVWLAEIKRENLPNEQSIRIRLKHFEEDQFERDLKV